MYYLNDYSSFTSDLESKMSTLDTSLETELVKEKGDLLRGKLNLVAYSGVYKVINKLKIKLLYIVNTIEKICISPKRLPGHLAESLSEIFKIHINNIIPTDFQNNFDGEIINNLEFKFSSVSGLRGRHIWTSFRMFDLSNLFDISNIKLTPFYFESLNTHYTIDMGNENFGLSYFRQNNEMVVVNTTSQNTRMFISNSDILELDKNQKLCISNIISSNISGILSTCQFKSTAYGPQNVVITGRVIYFKLENPHKIDISCGCDNQSRDISNMVSGLGSLELPQTCALEQVEPFLNIDPLERGEICTPDLNQQPLLKLNNTDDHIRDDLFIKFYDNIDKLPGDQARHILDSLTARAKLDQNSTDNSLWRLLGRVQARLSPFTGFSGWYTFKAWISMPSNALTVSLTSITIVIWTIIIYRCNRHRCTCADTADVKDLEFELAEIRLLIDGMEDFNT